MSQLPPSTGYTFPGLQNLHTDIYSRISASQTPSLHQPHKAVLITGASRGIGRSIVLQYAHAHVASLILCARSAPHLLALETEIYNINSAIRVHRFAFDFADTAVVHAYAEAVRAAEGRLDVLINNAGISTDWAPIARGDPEGWWNTLEVNLRAAYLFLHAFLPLMVETGKNHQVGTNVVNMTSIGAHIEIEGAFAYAVSKVALLRLTEFIEVEYKVEGVNAVGLHPGGVLTDMGASVEVLRPYMIDSPELAGGFCVWLTAERRPWLAGRYISATWDVDVLEQMKEEIVVGDKLRVRLVV